MIQQDDKKLADAFVDNQLVEPRTSIAFGNAQQSRRAQIKRAENRGISKVPRCRGPGRRKADPCSVPNNALRSPVRFSNRKHGPAAATVSSQSEKPHAELSHSQGNVLETRAAIEAGEPLKPRWTVRKNDLSVADGVEQGSGDE